MYTNQKQIRVAFFEAFPDLPRRRHRYNWTQSDHPDPALDPALDPAARRQGDRYVVTPADVEAFRRDGYVHLPGVMSDEEMAEIEASTTGSCAARSRWRARTSTT